MINMISVYIPFAKATIKSEYFAYKSRFFLWSIANTVSFLAQFFLWEAIYSNSTTPVLRGYSFEEMVSYIGVSKIVECMSFASVEGNVSNAIRDGRIINSLVKPINYRVELLFRALGQVLGSIILFLPIYLCVFGLFAYSNGLKLKFYFLNIVMGFAFLLVAFAMNYYISLIFSSFIFKTVKSTGVYQLKKTIISFFAGALFPIAFYPRFLQNVIKYLPFKYLRYYPSIVIQGKINLNDLYSALGIGLVWIIILAFISSMLWNRMIKKLIVFGG